MNISQNSIKRASFITFLSCCLNITYADGKNINFHTQKFTILNTVVDIILPVGLQLEHVVKLDKPRIISVSKKGEMFIGSKSGYIYRLSAPYNSVTTLLKLNNYPHSIVVRDGYLYIAQTNGLYRAPYHYKQKKIVLSSVTKYVAVPGGYGHNSRTVRIGPDNKIYLSLGISGNCSNQFIGRHYRRSQQRGGVMVLDEHNKNKLFWIAFASGLRNPVGFDWQPNTKVMYASNNGPDHWGFDLPREYFSKLLPGSFHGMPWFQFINNNIVRDNCINSKPPFKASIVQKPVVTFDARNAPMAVAFISKGFIAKRYFGEAIVALRGSWGLPDKGKYKGSKAGRREPKLVLVHFKKNQAIGFSDFVSGFQFKNGDRWARPIGVINAPDGNIYFTSDESVNGLFRITKVK